MRHNQTADVKDFPTVMLGEVSRRFIGLAIALDQPVSGTQAIPKILAGLEKYKEALQPFCTSTEVRSPSPIDVLQKLSKGRYPVKGAARLDCLLVSQMLLAHQRALVIELLQKERDRKAANMLLLKEAAASASCTRKPS
jgi:hypothetical protein